SRVERVALSKRSEDRCKVCFRLLRQDSGLQSRYRTQPVIAAVLALASTQVQRDVHRVRTVNRQSKAGRNDADNGVLATIHLYLLPDSGIAAAKILPPDLIAQDDHIVP